MALPKPEYPIYNLIVPSLEKTVKFRPFLVKEEKALLIAQQSEELKVMVDTLKSIIKSCVLDDIDVENLAIFDIEYMFTQIRSKSVGETVDLVFTCGHCKEKGNTVKIEIDLTKIPMVKNPKHNKTIKLSDKLGVIMRYPTIDALLAVDSDSVQVDANTAIDTVIDCILAVYDDKEVYYTKDQTREEVVEFVDNLNKSQFDLIEEFFVTVPKFQQKIDYKCPVCKADNSYLLKGTESFF